ncbi:MAG: response regulator [Deltaproteobacteria bacterium]|nr:response regulator [Deltaproteobacteria bacterium]MBI2540855.1 response regulator [Deltaproteobacteria bacterium]
MDSKRRILLAEDHPGTIEVMQTELEVLGYEVVVAQDGQEAVEKAATESPDLIVMDIIMPKLDGFQATARIRENPRTRDIPILAATALARPGDREKCLESGCDGYIAKPFTHRQLGAAIDRLFEARE